MKDHGFDNDWSRVFELGARTQLSDVETQAVFCRGHGGILDRLNSARYHDSVLRVVADIKIWLQEDNDDLIRGGACPCYPEARARILIADHI